MNYFGEAYNECMTRLDGLEPSSAIGEARDFVSSYEGREIRRTDSNRGKYIAFLDFLRTESGEIEDEVSTLLDDLGIEKEAA